MLFQEVSRSNSTYDYSMYVIKEVQHNYRQINSLSVGEAVGGEVRQETSREAPKQRRRGAFHYFPQGRFGGERTSPFSSREPAEEP